MASTTPNSGKGSWADMGLIWATMEFPRKDLAAGHMLETTHQHVTLDRDSPVLLNKITLLKDFMDRVKDVAKDMASNTVRGLGDYNPFVKDIIQFTLFLFI